MSNINIFHNCSDRFESANAAEHTGSYWASIKFKGGVDLTIFTNSMAQARAIVEGFERAFEPEKVAERMIGKKDSDNDNIPF